MNANATMTLTCNICGNEKANRCFTVVERMMGTLDEFKYVACSECGHLHLINIPDDLSRYYASGYYSFNRWNLPWWWRKLNKARTTAMFGGGNVVGRLLLALKKPWYCTDWLLAMGMQRGDRFLDVGCGAGLFLREMQAGGLTCTGIDPFLKTDEDTPEGVQLRRRCIKDEHGSYKGILFSHSLEHVRNPGQDLACARGCLERGGFVVVRIPLADSLAFWRYGADWFQIDAPRHLNVFTKKSFSILSRTSGLEIVQIWHDSTKDQFCFSEEYRAGICMTDSRSIAHNSHSPQFSKKDIVRFARWAKWANEMGVGDQATFLLKARLATSR